MFGADFQEQIAMIFPIEPFQGIAATKSTLSQAVAMFLRRNYDRRVPLVISRPTKVVSESRRYASSEYNCTSCRHVACSCAGTGIDSVDCITPFVDIAPPRGRCRF